jgi:hypothetical protein
VTGKVHIFGIRHHGPGCARSLKEVFAQLRPDCILIEGPPEGDALIPLVVHEQMAPPVALLVYAPDSPAKSVFYPFALFSPEWQALSFGVANNIPTRFIDLPQAHWLAMQEDAGKSSSQNEQTDRETPQVAERDESAGVDNHEDEDEDEDLVATSADPLKWLASAAGYSDSERWWEHMVEQRRDSEGIFASIAEAMTALRKEVPARTDKSEPYREAYMRSSIRKAQKDGFQKIAVVCGAWHVPALNEMPPAKEDDALLKKLSKIKVEATWIPWTHGRLSLASGYGAGVSSPGWYHHLWTCKSQVVERWMSRVAHLLRSEDLEASSAQVIDAVRLAESLAALRQRPIPGLIELSESIQSALCFGNDVPMRVIHQKLIVGEILGEVPPETPSVPLQKDLQREQKRLRMPPDIGDKQYDLDLRKPTDLERSHLLHRLRLLGIPWGREERVTGKSGTFHELWALRWMPEFSLALIEAGKWGKTLFEAADGIARDRVVNSDNLPKLTELLNAALLCDLQDAVTAIMVRVQEVAAISGDIIHIMQSIPPLVQIARYGNVRKTDLASVEHVIDGLVARVCIGLPGACGSLNDDAARQMFEKVIAVNSAIGLRQDSGHAKLWQEALLKLADRPNVHGLVSGRASRLLFDAAVLDSEETGRRCALALSRASEPSEAASWIEGFLSGSGLILIHDDSLWGVLDEWLATLTPETFHQILPLLRRTFSTFQPAERRQMGERAAAGTTQKRKTSAASIESRRGDMVLPVVAMILGLE